MADTDGVPVEDLSTLNSEVNHLHKDFSRARIDLAELRIEVRALATAVTTLKATDAVITKRTDRWIALVGAIVAGCATAAIFQVAAAVVRR